MKKFLPKIFVATITFILIANFIIPKADATTELSSEELTSISNHCLIIKDNIKTIQHEDSRAYDHLGGYFDVILLNFVAPLNLVLIKNNMPDTKLTDNQATFVTARTKFTSDYIKYQRDLEELLSLNCTSEPAKFYEKLTIAREDRTKVAADIVTLNSLIDKQIKLVTNIKEGL